jgi:Flp pilus assembly protein TadG
MFLRKFLRAREGVAAIEFAFIAPILIVLLLGSVELCYAVICREKVSTVAASAADLVAQDDKISGAQMNDVFSAINAILYPYPPSSTQIVVTSIEENSTKTGYIVDWSAAYHATARTKGAPMTVPAGLIVSGGSTILAEVTYTYTPPYTGGVTNGFTMTDSFYARPRQSTFVIYTP